MTTQLRNRILAAAFPDADLRDENAAGVLRMIETTDNVVLIHDTGNGTTTATIVEKDGTESEHAQSRMRPIAASPATAYRSDPCKTNCRIPQSRSLRHPPRAA